LYAKLSKCELWLEDMKFLRHVIFKERVLGDPTKVEIILQWEPPREIIEICNFLGLTRVSYEIY